MPAPPSLRQFRFRFVRPRGPRRLTAALLVAAISLLVTGSAGAIDVTLSGNVIGDTPEIVGYNSGHFMPGSNTADWWRYSGVNGARVWPTPSTVETTDDLAPWGDGVTTEATFLSRRTALRATPLSRQFFNWQAFENNYANNPTDGANIINLKHAFTQLRSMGMDTLVEINRTDGNGTPPSNYAFHPIDSSDPAVNQLGWADRWEHWQHFYAQAFHLSRNFDIHRFQMYNEPNIDDNDPNNPNDDLAVNAWLERLRLASDAVQSAVQDVNSIYGKSLVAEVNAPVLAGVSTSLFNTWGLPMMQKMHDTIDPNFRLVHTYSYQEYNHTGDQFSSNLANMKSLVSAAAGGEPMRYAITEFNVHTAGVFDTLTDTLNTPSKSSRMGSILANLANTQPDELYIFKFSQGPGDGPTGVKKNGTHFVDNNSSPYNIGGVTKGGEVVRLFAKGFAGANELFQVPSSTGTGESDVGLSASHDADNDRYYVFAANEASGADGARLLTLNFAQWGIEPESRIVIEEVSADMHGEVRDVVSMPANRILNYTQPAQSVLLFSVRKNKPAHEVTLTPTDDAFVQAGDNAGLNFGGVTTLLAKNDPLSPAARSVSFMKFNTGVIARPEIEQAILEVNGFNTGSASQVITHVYGLTNDAWNEATINWNNAPNLKDSDGTAVDDISENFIENIGTSAMIVGHFTGIAGTRGMALDVTSFVQSHPNEEVTFLITREVRYDGENVDDALTALQLSSKEQGAAGPKLSLMLSAVALPGDYDDDGVVDSADYEVWTKNFGSPTNAAADGDGSGIVDIGDYLVWQKYRGWSLPGTLVGGGGTSVPEPCTMVLAGFGLLRLALYRPER